MKDPIIHKISPQYGPQAGGTKVTITGDYLATGRKIDIEIGNATCIYDRFVWSSFYPSEGKGLWGFNLLHALPSPLPLRVNMPLEGLKINTLN